MKQENIVDFAESREGRDEIPPITSLMNSTFLVSGYEVRKGKGRDRKTGEEKEFDYAIVQTDMGAMRTASGVLIDQLGRMKSAFDDKKQVRVRLQQVANWFRFVSPTEKK